MTDQEFRDMLLAALAEIKEQGKNGTNAKKNALILSKHNGKQITNAKKNALILWRPTSRN